MDEYINEDDIVPSDNGEIVSESDIASVEGLSNYSRGPSTRGKYKPEISKAETIARLGAKGLTSGFIDELAAASGTYGEETADADYGMRSNFSDPNFKPRSREQLRTDYESARDQIRNDEAAAAKANPKTALAAEVAGTIVSPINKTPLGLKKGDTVVKTAAKLAGQGATYGAGTSEGETATDVAKDAALGGTVSAALGTPLTAATNKAFPAIANWLKNAVGPKALGAQVPQIKQLRNNRVSPEDVADYALNKQAIGKAVTETPIDKAAIEGSDKIKVLQALSENGAEGMAKRNDAIKQDAGRRIGEILQFADNTALDQIGRQSAGELAAKVEQQFGSQLTGSRFSEAGESTAVKNVINFLTKIDDQTGKNAANGGKPFSLQDLQQLKQDLRQSANYGKTAPGVESPAADVYKKVITLVDDAIEDYLEKASRLIQDAPEYTDDLLGRFMDAKRTYQLSRATENLIDNAEIKESGLNTFGLSSRIAGQGSQALVGGLLGSQFSDDPTMGAILGAGIGGAASQLSVKAADKYLPSIGANIGNKLKNAQPVVEKGLDVAYKAAPAYFNNLKSMFQSNKKQDDEAAKKNAEKSFQKSR